MASTKPIRITVKAPRGTKPGDSVVKKAQDAAQAVLNQFGALYQTVADLNSQGIAITVEELLSRRGASAKAAAKKPKAPRKGKKVARKAKAPAKKKAKGKSKRTVLSAEQRKSLTDKLKAGATAAKVAAEFGVSTATVNNIKRAAGLTKPRAKGKSKAGKAAA